MAITLSSDPPPTTSPTAGDNFGRGITYTKDYSIVSLNMLSGQFITIDLKPSMIELSIYEDIYSNFISGEIMIVDAQGYVEKMGMQGNEYIRISFGKDDNKDIRIDKIFRVYKISSRQKMSGYDADGYVIHFCSDEVILSEQYRISKAYSNKVVSDMIYDILKTHLKVPDNKLNVNNIQKSKGLYNFVIPNFKPFEALNWLSMYAQPASADAIGSDMILYENGEGYNFASLQTLFKKKEFFRYQYRPKNVSPKEFCDDEHQVFNVLGYEITNSFNSVEGVSSGMFANRLMTLDPLAQRYLKTDFNYKDYQEKAGSLNKNPIVNNMENRFGDALYESPEGCFKLAFGNKNQSSIDYIKNRPGSVNGDIYAETFLSQRKSQLALANYTRMKIFISGDPNVTIGNTIKFDLLTQNPATPDEPKEYDEQYSGKYLITAVRHLIQTGGYNTIIEVVKDSVPTAYTPIDNSKSIFKNTVNGVKR
jgi:hypothetical protein